MMEPSPEYIELEDLLTEIAERDQKAKQRAYIYTALPVLLIMMLIWYSYTNIKEANDKVNHVRRHLDDIEKESYNLPSVKSNEELMLDVVTASTAVINAIKDKPGFSSETKSLQSLVLRSDTIISNIHETLESKKRLIRCIYFPTSKDLQVQKGETDSLLRYFMNIDNDYMKWRLDSDNPIEGFDSKGFVQYVIRKFNLSEPIAYQDSTQLKSGDIIYYQNGYQMFYFKGAKPFCIGMTHLGVWGFNPHFGPKIIGYGKMNL